MIIGPKFWPFYDVFWINLVHSAFIFLCPKKSKQASKTKYNKASEAQRENDSWLDQWFPPLQLLVIDTESLSGPKFPFARENSHQTEVKARARVRVHVSKTFWLASKEKAWPFFCTSLAIRVCQKTKSLKFTVWTLFPGDPCYSDSKKVNCIKIKKF